MSFLKLIIRIPPFLMMMMMVFLPLIINKVVSFREVKTEVNSLRILNIDLIHLFLLFWLAFFNLLILFAIFETQQTVSSHLLGFTTFVLDIQMSLQLRFCEECYVATSLANLIGT